MAAAFHSVRFPGESQSYRTLRDQLLEAEMSLRRKVEEVAALRRQLPAGGEVPQDYVFTQGAPDLSDSTTEKKVRMSELFAPGKDTLVLYSYMFGPAMKEPCFSCTSILDGLNGVFHHLNQRVNFYAVAKSPIQRIRNVARERGWNRLRLLSSEGNTYNTDYRGENEKGSQIPSLNVFTRKNGKIHHFYNTELFFVPPEPGQDNRHVDMIWPVWNVFDYTPEGRGTDWYPRLKYQE